MAELQQNDEEIQAYQMAITDLKFDDIQIGNGQRFLLCDVSTAFPRPVVPRTLRRQVFEVLHNLSHPSLRATKRLIAERFVWHGLHRDVDLWAKSCSLRIKNSKAYMRPATGLR